MNYNIDRTKQLTNLQYQTRRDSLLELLSIFTTAKHQASTSLEKYKKEFAELDAKYKDRYDKYLDKEYKAVEEWERNEQAT